MIRITDKARCCGCHACVGACPWECIGMKEDAEGFLYPEANPEHCIECGRCEEACPLIHTPEPPGTPRAFAAVSRDGAARAASSSGGSFSLLAEKTLSRGGVVFGAAFDEAFEVRHTAAETAAELSRLCGSKYVLRRIGVVYLLAEELLREGREVLFTGTPCQIAGLRTFLGRDYDNLSALDIICHGVPSPRAWRRFLACREREAESRAAAVSFRRKDEGWRRFSMAVAFENGAEYRKTFKEDPYLQSFLKDAISRPSCYDCAFKTLGRVSDITLADFWGVNKFLPALDDNKGTSLLLVHTPRGERMLDEIRDSLDLAEADPADAVRYNQSATQSARTHPNRAAFLARAGREDPAALYRELVFAAEEHA